jgi:hypothetical protein
MKQLNQYASLLLMLFSLNNFQMLAEQTTVTAVPANDFLNSIGVNTSIGSRGETPTETLKCAKYLGFRWIRTGVPNGVDTRINHLRWLFEDCGIRFSYLLGNTDNIQALTAGVKDLIDKVSPDAFLAFEGSNEPNNWGIFYNGEYGGGRYDAAHPGPNPWKPLAKYHRDLYATVKADPILGTAGRNYPVWSATDIGACWENVGMQFLTIPEGAVGVDPEFPAGTTFADVACVHNYFSGNTAYSNNQTWRAAAITGKNGIKENFGVTWAKKYQGYTDEQLATLPRVTTETGTTVNTSGTVVTEQQQGLTYLSCYLAQFKQGFSHTAMYILRDRVDEGGNQSYGFYVGNSQYTPRLSAHYLHNMTTILNDRTSIQNPGTLTYGFTGTVKDYLHDLLLQKNDGTMMLVVWGEKFAKNAATDDVTLVFDQPFAKINVYNPAQYNASDPEIGTRPIATYTNVSSIPLALLNHPFILEINPVETAINEVNVAEKTFSSAFLAENTLFLRTTSDLKKVELFDLTGRKVFQQVNIKAGYADFNIGSLSAGSYIIRVTSLQNQVENHKVIR